MARRAMMMGVGFLVFAALAAIPAQAQAQTGPALTGKVTAEQGALEGVLVSAKKTARPSPSRW